MSSCDGLGERHGGERKGGFDDEEFSLCLAKRRRVSIVVFKIEGMEGQYRLAHGEEDVGLRLIERRAQLDLLADPLRPDLPGLALNRDTAVATYFSMEGAVEVSRCCLERPSVWAVDRRPGIERRGSKRQVDSSLVVVLEPLSEGRIENLETVKRLGLERFEKA